jgi:sugar lactone lactonase YvrE
MALLLLCDGCLFHFDRVLSPGDLTGLVEAILPGGDTEKYVPIEKASVELPGTSMAPITTNAQGTFRFEHLSSGTYTLAIHAVATDGTPIGLFELSGLQIPVGGALDLGTIRLDAAGGIHGTVYLQEPDGGRVAVPGATLTVLAADGGTLPGLPPDQSDSEGGYSIPFLPAGQERVAALFTVTTAAARETYTAVSDPVTVLPRAITQVDLTLTNAQPAMLPDAGSGADDAGSTDAGSADAGSPPVDGGTDAGSPVDAGLIDGGPAGVSTVAGNGTAGFMNGTGGAGGTAEFSLPDGVAVDSQGTIYVADRLNNRIRKIDSSGNVTTLAGSGDGGFVDGPANVAELSTPVGVAVDAQGNVYVGDEYNSRIRKIDPSGNVTTLAGNGTASFADGTGGPAGTAEFQLPYDVAVDSAGNVYVADSGNNRIRKIDPSGNVTTLAGNGALGFADGTGGPDGTAEFNDPTGVAVDQQGNVYVADRGNRSIRAIDPAGNVTTLAGHGDNAFADGTGGLFGTAAFEAPESVAVDSLGNVYVADSMNNRIRKIDLFGDVTTVAGNGNPGDVDGTNGPNGTSEFDFPTGIAVDSAGRILVADQFNDRIRLIVQESAGAPDAGPAQDGGTPNPDAGIFVTTLAGSGDAGYAEGHGSLAEFATPYGVALDGSGNVYVADSMNYRIRKIDASGNVTTIAGNGVSGWVDGFGGADGGAELYRPYGTAVDAMGNVYVADADHRIRRIDSSGNVTTLAGNGGPGFADGTGGAHGTAMFRQPEGVAATASGIVYVADFGNHRIRMIDTSGNVTTLAGNGHLGWADGTGGPDGGAEFDFPSGVAVDSSGAIYVADRDNNRVRKIDGSGMVTTLAGNGLSGYADGTGGPNGTAELNYPSGIAVDPSGVVYVADEGNDSIRRIDTSGNVTTVAGHGNYAFVDGLGGVMGTAAFASPFGVAVDALGRVYVGDSGNNRIRLVMMGPGP